MAQRRYGIQIGLIHNSGDVPESAGVHVQTQANTDSNFGILFESADRFNGISWGTLDTPADIRSLYIKSGGELAGWISGSEVIFAQYGDVVKSVNGTIDDIDIIAGTGITVDTVGQEITISATGGGGSGPRRQVWGAINAGDDNDNQVLINRSLNGAAVSATHQPDVARVLEAYSLDGGVGAIVFTGKDIDGNAITDTLTLDGTATTMVGIKAFASINAGGIQLPTSSGKHVYVDVSTAIGLDHVISLGAGDPAIVVATNGLTGGDDINAFGWPVENHHATDVSQNWFYMASLPNTDLEKYMVVYYTD